MTLRPWLACCALAVTFASCVPEAPPAPQAAPAPTSAPEPPAKDAAAEPAAGFACEDDRCWGLVSDPLRAALGQRTKAARGCFEELQRRAGASGGRVVVLTRVAGDGRVCSQEVLEKAIDADDAFYACVVDVFSGELPAPSEGCVDLALPIDFSAPPEDAGAPDT